MTTDMAEKIVARIGILLTSSFLLTVVVAAAVDAPAAIVIPAAEGSRIDDTSKLSFMAGFCSS